MSRLLFLIELSQEIRDEQRNLLRILRRTLRDGQNPFKVMTEEHFIELYRIPKVLYLELINELIPFLPNSCRKHSISSQVMVLSALRFFATGSFQRINELIPFLPNSCRKHSISSQVMVLSALRFFATGSFQRSVGQDSLSALSQTSVSRCVRAVATAINKIAHKYIKFPKRDEFPSIQLKFMEKFQFPGVIGLIDGTHIKISAPKNEIEHVYYCRKGGHSKNVMIICDADYLILAANAQFGGTAHDSFVWRRSRANNFLEELYETGERNFWLLGDSGYPLQPWLKTPIQATTSVPEERYNVAHKTTRALVERCIGIIKSRFRCLSKERALFYSPPKAGLIINACLVLHNFLIRKRVPLPEIYEDYFEETEENVSSTSDFLSSTMLSVARRQRLQIVQDVFSSSI